MKIILYILRGVINRRNVNALLISKIGTSRKEVGRMKRAISSIILVAALILSSFNNPLISHGQASGEGKDSVKYAVAIEHVSFAILQKQTPKLPEKLTVYFSDGTEQQADVIWADIPSEKVGKVGVFDVEGTIEGIDLKAKAHIRVTDEVGGQQNISRAKKGYEYPKAEASFTNAGAGSNDRIEAINDDVISYGEVPHNRWTNWQSQPRSGDWVSITFGDHEPKEYDVDTMEIHWFGDHGTSYPAFFKIQYKSEGKWVDVANLQIDPASSELGRANFYTFDTVSTSAIRLDMIAQPGMSLAITEVKVLSKSPKIHTEPKVTDIKLDGKSILNDFTKKAGNYEYNVEISSLEEIPQIMATGEDNTSITIVPAISALSTTKVIAKSEDGKKKVEYSINIIPKTEPLPEIVLENILDMIKEQTTYGNISHSLSKKLIKSMEQAIHRRDKGGAEQKYLEDALGHLKKAKPSDIKPEAYTEIEKLLHRFIK